ncbi:hypothetical protein TH66_23120 [Carbonactinospora thermoautotrophica]|uniref:Phenazine biosynthesis PhzC/PhzF protein n=2 Tax=Carbonactinospora thermoautotrophica TaxID=1469144 RepID=A0A132MY94_9ACTN|nr:PhzF family phenazine biosynthesis protein [Carbonactinospora thermoautotrophica]KWW98144.1 hypothetical protein TH66_23120 [Carbonactinospora thermoautotrophica]KWX02839.1 Phenazine biosynthesis PhzC/PhzF protein [Carbonactinospora thermoautotrophica]
MVQVHVLRVFTDAAGRYGNPLGVVLDPAGLDQEERQAVAAELGFSETVFVDDVAAARLQIFTPTMELPLAGHPLVGTSWLIAQETGRPVQTLRPIKASQEVASFVEDGATWIRAAVADAPPWEHVQLADAAQVEGAAVPGPGERWQMTQVWAWADEAAGRVRARVFALAAGVAEDEACGSASLVLASRLDRALTIVHGQGSVVRARPAGPGYAEVGGFVAHDGVRAL